MVGHIQSIASGNVFANIAQSRLGSQVNLHTQKLFLGTATSTSADAKACPPWTDSKVANVNLLAAGRVTFVAKPQGRYSHYLDPPSGTWFRFAQDRAEPPVLDIRARQQATPSGTPNDVASKLRKIRTCVFGPGISRAATCL